MSLRRLPEAFAALGLTGLLMTTLAGCTVEVGNRGDATTPAEPAQVDQVAPQTTEPAPVEPTEVAEPLTVILEDEWVDSDGYTYRMTVTQAYVWAETNTLDALPGEADITVGMVLTGTIENLTPDRNAPIPELYFQPVWSLDSAFCQVSASYVTATDFSSNQDTEPRWCTIYSYFSDPWLAHTVETYDSVAEAQNADIPEGQTIEIQMYATTMGSIQEFSVPEADADAVVAAVQSPPLWVFARDQGQSDPSLCSIAMGGFIYNVAAWTTPARCISGTE